MVGRRCFAFLLVGGRFLFLRMVGGRCLNQYKVGGRWLMVGGLWSVAGRWTVVLYYASISKPLEMSFQLFVARFPLSCDPVCFSYNDCSHCLVKGFTDSI